MTETNISQETLNLLLVGRCDVELDTKRRIQLPAKWRDELPSVRQFMLVATETDDDKWACLKLLPISVYSDFYLSKINSLKVEDPNRAARMQAYLDDREEKVSLDSAGRIMLPAKLLKKVGIEEKSDSNPDGGKVALVGQHDRIAIWNPKKLALDKEKQQIAPEDKLIF